MSREQIIWITLRSSSKQVIEYVRLFTQYWTCLTQPQPHQIADWVAESVLSKEDSRKRANVVKQLILVADVSTKSSGSRLKILTIIS